MWNFLKPTKRKLLWFILLPLTQILTTWLFYLLHNLHIPYMQYFFLSLGRSVEKLIFWQIDWLFNLLTKLGFKTTVHLNDLMSWDPPSTLGWMSMLIGIIITLLLYYIIACYIVKKRNYNQ